MSAHPSAGFGMGSPEGLGRAAGGNISNCRSVRRRSINPAALGNNLRASSLTAGYNSHAGRANPTKIRSNVTFHFTGSHSEQYGPARPAALLLRGAGPSSAGYPASGPHEDGPSSWVVVSTLSSTCVVALSRWLSSWKG